MRQGRLFCLALFHQQNHLGGFDDEYYTYNYTGHPLTKRHVHSTVTYSYNVRSWLMGISSTHFQESLSYNATNVPDSGPGD